MTVQAVFEERTDPYPLRFWWTRRIAAVSFLLLLLVAAARLWWGHDVDARVLAEVNSIHARGEPVLPEDFTVSPVSDDKNVATYLTQASNALNPAAYPPLSTMMIVPNYLPMSAEWYDVARKAVEGNQQSLKFARQARQYQLVDWNLQFRTPLISLALPSLNTQRALANLLADTALYEHLHGNDAEAIERISDMLHAADAIEQQPFLVSHLVSIGIYAMAMQQLELMAPGLRVADDPSPAPTTQPVAPVPREQIVQVIQLLMARSNSRNIRKAFVGERAAVLDTAQWSSQNGYLLRPMYQLDALHVMKINEQQTSAATQPTLPMSQSAWPAYPSLPSGSLEYVRLLSSAIRGSLNRVMVTDFRVRSECEMAAVMLAARLYQIDHQGQWPANLQVLVPQYLPSVAIDLMSPGRQPVGYILAETGKRPMVYSVGEDGRDDTVNGAKIPSMPQIGWSNTTPDQLRDISRVEPPE